MKNKIKLLNAVINKKIHRQMLKNVALKVKTLQATDLEVSVIVPFDSELQESIVSFDLLKASLAKNLKKIEDIDHWPNLPALYINWRKCEGIKSILKSISFAMSEDETREYLCGCYFHDNFIVATDGHRLMRNFTNHGMTGILPAKAVKILTSNYFALAEMGQDDNFFFFRSSCGAVMSARKINHEYPKYEAIIPKKLSNHLMLSKQEVVNNLKPYLKLLGSKKIVRFIAKDENIMMIGYDCNTMELFSEKIFGKCSEANLEIAFNADYLLDAIKDNKNATFTFWYSDVNSPCVFSDENEANILMPIRV